MPKFKYKAKKGINEIVEGVIFADNEANASKKLSEQNLFPIEVKPQNSDVSSKKGLSFLKQEREDF